MNKRFLYELLFLTAGIVFFAACKPRSFNQSDVASEGEGIGPLFSSEEVLKLAIKAPFKKVFATKNQTEPVPPPGVGTMSYTKDGTETRLNVEVEVRGNTSVSICNFPKLKIEMTDPKEIRAKTIFVKNKKMRVATHCAKPPTIIDARRGDAIAVNRERYAYKIMEIVDLPRLQTRRAEITYADSETGEAQTQPAFLIETFDKSAERIGFEDITDSLQELSYPDRMAVRDNFPKENLAKLELFEILIGNGDWQIYGLSSSFGVAPFTIWNVRAYREKGADKPKYAAVANDFDLSSLVIGYKPELFPSETISSHFMTNQKDEIRMMAYQLQRLRAKDYGLPAIQSAVATFLGKKEQLLQALRDSNMDTAGINAMSGRMRPFFELISEAQLFTETVLEDNVSVFTTSTDKKVACQVRAAGAIMNVLEQKGTRKKIEFLDMSSEPAACADVNGNPVMQGWVESVKIGKSFPAK